MCRKLSIKMVCAIAMAVFLLFSFGQTAHAQLSAFGPVDLADGFPTWYQDLIGLSLEQCIPDADELANGICLLLPADIPDSTIPISFPDNFPVEFPYWEANAIVTIPPSVDLPAGGLGSVRVTIFGSFANLVTPLANDQVVVARIRFRIDVPTAGDYTITYPFGTKQFLGVPAGRRAINDTVDIGVLTPLDFAAALNGGIGPFLQASATPGGAPLAPIPLPLIGAPGKLYLADPNIPTAITGGVNNVFRIVGPGVDISETQFALIGRVFAAPTAPVATNDTATTAGVGLDINVLANDAAPAGGALNPASVIVTPPTSGIGTATASLAGTVSYTPNGFVGTDIFTYTVADLLGNVSNTATVTVTVTNAAPVAVNDAATTNAGVAAIIPVAANDTDADGTVDPATVAIKTAPVNGTAVANPAGTVTYTPNAGFVGTDSFTYTVKDNLGAESNAATVSVDVINTPPVAVNDSATTTLNKSIVINVLANDTDAEGNIAPATVAIGTPANGTAVLNSGGTVTYTPGVNFSGADSFTYTVQDALGLTSNIATISVTVTGIPDAIEIIRPKFNTKRAKWTLSGVLDPGDPAAPLLGNSIVLRAGADFKGPVIGTAVTNKRGKFKLNIKGSTALPDATNTLSCQSPNGTLLLAIPVAVK
jgi:hypothetical protein